VKTSPAVEIIRLQQSGSVLLVQIDVIDLSQLLLLASNERYTWTSSCYQSTRMTRWSVRRHCQSIRTVQSAELTFSVFTFFLTHWPRAVDTRNVLISTRHGESARLDESLAHVGV